MLALALEPVAPEHQNVYTYKLKVFFLSHFLDSLWFYVWNVGGQQSSGPPFKILYYKT